MPAIPSAITPSIGDAFSCRTARAHGVPPKRLRAKDLERPFHGARLRPLPLTDRDEDDAPLANDRAALRRVRRRVAAYATVMRPHAFVAGLTAMALFGAPLRSHFDAEAPLVIGTTAPHSAPRGRGVHGIRFSPALVTTVVIDGITTASPASTWAMLAGELTTRELVAFGDFLVCVPRDDRGRSLPHRRLAGIEQLHAAAFAPGRRHRGILIAALGQIRVGSMSPLETDCRLDVLAGIEPEADLDAEIRDADGHLIGVCDLVFRQYSTIVEVEGDHHRTSRRQWERDIEKYAALAAAGWEVVRLTARHIRGAPEVGGARVRAALARHGWRDLAT